MRTFFRAMLTFAGVTYCGPAWSASFDCSKARRPLEKFICANPELDAADSRLGEVYKRVRAGFPLKEFLHLTQQDFLSNSYAHCMKNSYGKPLTGAHAVRKCVDTLLARTNELESQALARVYTDTSTDFRINNTAILLYAVQGLSRIRLWGSYMPDAYDRSTQWPTAGFLCDINEPLKPVQGGFKIETGKAIITVSDNQVTISEFISCSPRNGIEKGSYARVR